MGNAGRGNAVQLHGGQRYSVANLKVKGSKMKISKISIAAGVAALTFVIPGLQAGPGTTPPGFGHNTTTTQTQGNSGKPAKDNGNQGIKTTTYTETGPKGALKNGTSPDSTVTTETTSSGPGNSQHDTGPTSFVTGSHIRKN